jgi:hypothetical protein
MVYRHFRVFCLTFLLNFSGFSEVNQGLRVTRREIKSLEIKKETKSLKNYRS